VGSSSSKEMVLIEPFWGRDNFGLKTLKNFEKEN